MEGIKIKNTRESQSGLKSMNFRTVLFFSFVLLIVQSISMDFVNAYPVPELKENQQTRIDSNNPAQAIAEPKEQEFKVEMDSTIAESIQGSISPGEKPDPAQCDNDPPFWSDHFPTPKSTNVPRETRQIKFKLRDEMGGVDRNTFHLVVDGVDIYQDSPGLFIKGNNDRYLIITYDLQSGHNFAWGDTIWVKLDVCDKWKPANCMNDSIYFVIEQDDVIPEIIPYYPVDQAIDIPINTPIRFDIKEVKSGIDFSTLSIKLNGEPVEADSMNADPFNARVVVNSIQDSLFLYSSVVQVDVTVHDSAGNIGEATYSFTTIKEAYPPKIHFVYPGKNSTEQIGLADSLVFQITDDISGINSDVTEIELKINDEVIEFDVINVRSTEPKGFQYSIKPVSSFKYNDTGVLKVKAVDVAGNFLEDENAFAVIADETAPEIALIQPSVSNDIYPSHEIQIQLSDDIAGVNLDSLQISINGTEIPPADIRIEGNASQYIATMNYSGDWANLVSIDVRVADFALNSATKNFSYKILADEQGPEITLVQPTQQVNVPFIHSIEVHIADLLSGVDKSSIVLNLDGEIVESSEYTITGDSANYILTLQNTAAWNAEIVLQVQAADLEENSSTETFTWKTPTDFDGPEIVFLKPVQQKNVPENYEIAIQLNDILSGVDIDALKITLNGSSVENYNVTGDSSQYIVSWQQTSALGEHVELFVQAMDFAKNPNEAELAYDIIGVPDNDGPMIELVQPDTRVKVLPEHTIELRLSDNGTGVDSATVVIKLNGSAINEYSIKGEPAVFSIDWNQISNYGDDVNLEVEVEDYAGNHSGQIFQYEILDAPDGTAPEISLISPDPLIDVPLTHEVRVQIADDASGVDAGTIEIVLNGVPVENYKITGTPVAYTISWEQTGNYNDVMNLVVRASDNSENPAEKPFEYKLIEDSVGPEITLILPNQPDSVAISHLVKLIISDARSGVDADAFAISMNGAPISNYDITGDASEYTISWTQTGDFEQNMVLKVHAEDFADNSSDSTFEYKIVPMGDPCLEIALVKPETSVDVPPVHAVEIKITDECFGVIEDSIRITMNGIPVENYQSVGDASELILSWEQTADYGADMMLKVWAQDKGMHKFEKEFPYKIESDLVGPEIVLVQPTEKTGVPKSHDIALKIADKKSGIDLSSLTIIMNGVPVENYNTSGGPAEYSISWNQTGELSQDMTLNVRVQDFVQNQTDSTFNYRIVDPVEPCLDIALLSPDTLSTIEPTHSVELKLSDSCIGVDAATLTIHVNGEPMEPVNNYVINGTPSEYTVKWEQSGDYGQAINIKVQVKDLEANVFQKEFNYQIKPDVIAPVITLLEPEQKNNVAPNHTVMVRITDEGAGVLLSSLSLKMNGSKIEGYKIAAFTGGYVVSWEQSAKLDEHMILEVEVTDAYVVPNPAKATFEYDIIRNDDLTPPVITVLQPEQQQNVPAKHLVKVAISDNGVGVDPESVVFKINDITVEPDTITIDSITYIYTWTQEAGYGATVRLNIVARDKVGNSDDLEYVYTILSEPDDTKPVISLNMPENGATNVPRQHEVQVQVTDAGSGVNKENVAIKVNGELFKDYEVEGNPSGYKFSWTQTAEYNKLMQIDVVASDYAGNSDSARFEYQIEEEPDLSGPTIILVKPDPRENVNPEHNIVVEISDGMSGVKLDSLLFTLNGDTVRNPEVSGTPAKYSVTWKNTGSLGQIFKLGVHAVDLKGNPTDSLFQYRIIKEDYTEITLITPKDKAVDVPPVHEVMIRIIEVWQGLDEVKILLNGAPFEKYTRTGSKSISYFKWDQHSDWNSSVELIVQTKDEAGNAAVDTFFYKILEDKIGPEISVVSPQNYESVGLDEPIKLEISDAISGVDLNCFSLKINGKAVQGFDIVGDSSKYVITYYHPQSWNDVVTVEVNACDFAGNPATSEKFSYAIAKDRVPPTIDFTKIEPDTNKTENEIGSRIHISITDTLSGVNSATMKYYWKYFGHDQLHVMKSDSVWSINYGYSLIVSPKEDDRPSADSLVIVLCEAADFAGNFTIERSYLDTEGPTVELKNPATQNINDIIQSVFSFLLKDEASAIDRESVKVTISVVNRISSNGMEAPDVTSWASTDKSKMEMKLTDVNSEQRKVNVVCTAKTFNSGNFEFFYNDIISMVIEAKDIYGNSIKKENAEYRFNATIDNTPPFVESIFPDNEASDVLPETNLKIQLSDDHFIDLSTIKVQMLSLSSSENVPEKDDERWGTAKQLVYPVDSLKITVPDRVREKASVVVLEAEGLKLNLNYNSKVCFRIEAYDIVVQTDTTIKWFNTRTMNADLSVTRPIYQARKYSVKDSVRFQTTLKNEIADIYEPIYVDFELVGESVKKTFEIFPPFKMDQSVVLSTTFQMPSQGTHTIKVTAHGPADANEENNSRSSQIGIEGGHIEVKSNPFTPNGDGINDDAYFKCEEFKLEQPTLKLFDLRGRLVVELTEMDRANKRFKWSGRDKNGHEVMPGVYLFILQDQGKALKNGHVVVAR